MTYRWEPYPSWERKDFRALLPYLLVAVRKETQRLVEAGKRRCSDWITLPKLPRPHNFAVLGVIYGERKDTRDMGRF